MNRGCEKPQFCNSVRIFSFSQILEGSQNLKEYLKAPVQTGGFLLTNNVAFIISCSSKFLSEVVEMSICNKHGLLEVFQTTLFRKEVPDYKFFPITKKFYVLRRLLLHQLLWLRDFLDRTTGLFC